MTTILAYCDPISAAPGDTVRFMVSCEGAAEYQAEIVRLTNPEAEPEATPFRVEPVATPASRSYPARRQELLPGSYGIVEPDSRLDQLESWTLSVYLWPTTPTKGRQALLGAWSEPEQRGFGLFLDEQGAPEARIGDGRGGVFKVGTGTPLFERRWYHLAASFDASSGRLELHQTQVIDKMFDPEGARDASAMTTIRPDASDLPFLFAAWHAGPCDAPSPDRPLTAGGHFNGKLDSPRLANRALSEIEIAMLAAGAMPDHLITSIVAAWDFSIDIPSETLVDISAQGMNGRLINLPARAMTGHNWTGEATDWTQAPEQYGAIHFHDDDMVDAAWEADFSFTAPDDLRSGIYAARLRASEAEFWVVFFVRPPKGTATAKIAFLASTATYTVYMNNRARFTSPAVELYQGRLTIMDATDRLLFDHPGIGISTYDRHSDGSGVCYSSRHRPVTNVRPNGRHWNFNLDLFIIDWLEHLGVDYDVITEEDLHEEGLSLLRPYAVVLTGSHPEYESLEMLDAMDAYLRHGGRFMYMGGNGFYWRIAHHPTRRGVIEVRRAEGGLRAWDALPGEYFHSFTGEYGGLWRRQGRAPQKLAGVGFISQGFDKCSYYRRLPASQDPRVAFMFEGIQDELLGNFGILQGGTAGIEIDSADHALGTPTHALVVARSENHSNTYELVPEEVRIPHGATNALQNREIHADLTFFETPEGGAVFSTGSIAYAGSLSWNGFDNNIARLTTNVLMRFADERPFVMPASSDRADE